MTPKQEAFARAYVETGNASEAYRQAYNAENMQDQTVWNRASELLQHGEVAGRVQQLKEQHNKRHVITVDKLTDMTMAAYQMAMKEENAQSAAAVKASEFLGKLHGLVVERREVKNVSAAEDMDDHELASVALAGRRGTSATPQGSPQSH